MALCAHKVSAYLVGKAYAGNHEAMPWHDRFIEVMDEVLSHLELEDLLRVRRVNKAIYFLSHTRVNWACQCYWSDPYDLPPRAPVTDPHSFVSNLHLSVSALDLERVAVRAASLRKVYARANPRPLATWSFNSDEGMISQIALLPGSEYFVAVVHHIYTVENVAQVWYKLVLYTMDTPSGARAVASTPIGEREPEKNTLEAKYMTVNGVVGISVAFVLRYSNPSLHSSSAVMIQADLHKPVDCYALCALHIALDPFQRLAGSAPRPGSPEYSSFAAAFTSPSTTISEVPQDAVLSKPAIGTLYGAPYVVSSWCADGENHIVFKNLEGGHPSFLKILRSPNAKSRQNYVIKALRIIPGADAILAVRGYTPTPGGYESHVKSIYPGVPCAWDEEVRIETHEPDQPIPEDLLFPAGRWTEVHITDPVLPQPSQHSWYALTGIERGPRTRLPPLHILARSFGDNSNSLHHFVRITSYPRLRPVPDVDMDMVDMDWSDLMRATHPTADTRSLQSGCSGVTAPPPIDLPKPNLSSYDCAPAPIPGFPVGAPERWTYADSWPDKFAVPAPGWMNYRILPGAHRPLICAIEASEEDPHSIFHLKSIYPYRDDLETPLFGKRKLRGCSDIPTIFEERVQGVVETLVQEYGDSRVRTIAWDDSIGRLIVVHPACTSPCVFDFAAAPALDELGRCKPLALEPLIPQLTYPDGCCRR
ncbi:hypothetical protein C8Q74DRAFT_136674 [Fomes fomentarius]|nr:hypothetical protein C8Q74DRAFT_136674 [Fomes fomentarius]